MSCEFKTFYNIVDMYSLIIDVLDTDLIIAREDDIAQTRAILDDISFFIYFHVLLNLMRIYRTFLSLKMVYQITCLPATG